MKIEIRRDGENLLTLNSRGLGIIGKINKKELKQVQSEIPQILSANVKRSGSRLVFKDGFYESIEPVSGQNFAVEKNNGQTILTFKENGFIKSRDRGLIIEDIGPLDLPF